MAETQEPTTDIEIELQESEAPNAATLPSSSKVAEKPATHSVAETQEPAMAETQETTTAETQEPAADSEIELQDLETQTSFVFEAAETQIATYPVVETQEPPADIEIDIQELEVQGAATLLFLHQEAETQATTTIPTVLPNNQKQQWHLSCRKTSF